MLSICHSNTLTLGLSQTFNCLTFHSIFTKIVFEKRQEKADTTHILENFNSMESHIFKG